MATRNFVFEEIALVLGTYPLRDYADGDSISISMAEDGFAVTAGSHGSFIRSKKFAGPGKATIRLMPGSPSNAYLSALYNEDRRTARGVRDLFIKDPRADKTYVKARAWIDKPADMAFGQELGAREWSLTLTEVEMSDGINELA